MFSFLQPAAPAARKVPPSQVASSYRLHQVGVLISLSLGYIGYYIIRLIFATEQNDIMAQYGFTTAEIGLVLSCFGIGYGTSKLLMGALADKSHTTRYLATGLIISAILNIGLGSTKNLYLMMLLMLIMSVAQGMGGAACQRGIQLWWGKKWRGTIYAIWASAHNAGAFACVAVVQIATFFFTGSIAAVFYTASAVSILIAILVLILGTDRPEAVGLPNVAKYTGDKVVLSDGQLSEDDQTDQPMMAVFIQYILKNPMVWAIALTSMSLYIVRYGIMSWIPSYLVENKGFSADFAKWLIGIFELAAVPGVILIGLISDLLKDRRGLVCLVSVIGLIGCLMTYFTSTNHGLIVVTLFIMGTLIYAPLALVGLMVNEAVPKFAVGTSTGFTGFFQYIFGETLATALIGILVHHYGWIASDIVLYSAAGLSVLLLIYITIKEARDQKRARQRT
ncbi:MFS transporter [Leuconostocaceae bacterium ESL0723]|nr:MFS transporter [Leuconostocaceae bacterium ESL0723]